MTYTKVHEEWEDLPSTNTPIDAASLDQIEAGIADAQDDADSANTSIGNHLADGSGAHAASAISFSPVGTVGASTVQAAIAEVATDAAALVTDHTGDSSGAHVASAITFTPAAGLSSTTVQAAIAEVAGHAGTGTVDSITNGTGITVDDTDAANPTVAVDTTVIAPLASPTFTGDVVVPDADADTEALNRQTGDGRFVRKAAGGKETVSTVAAAGATETLDLANGNVFDVTLDENVTFTFSGSTASVACSFTLILRQDGSGGNSVTWPASVDWPDASVPTLPTGASAVSILTFVTVNNGTTWFGMLAGDSFG